MVGYGGTGYGTFLPPYIWEPVEALYFAPVGITEMAIHDATTAAFLQVEEVSLTLCCDTTITEGTMALKHTPHTLSSL